MNSKQFETSKVVISETRVLSATHPIVTEDIMHINGKTFTVISHFNGNETASKLLHDMAVRRIINEDLPKMSKTQKTT